MSRQWIRAAVAVATVSVSIVALSPSALAHKRHRVGPVELVIGWAQEPAYAGIANAVEVQLTRGGEPASVADTTLSVAVLFGAGADAVSSEPLVLEPAGATGVYEAFLIPTRPGAYTFHLNGRVGGETIDERFRSGPRSFDDVQTPSEAQFPERDPTAAEIADRLERIDARLAALAEDGAGAGTSSVPTVLAAAALLFAAAALVVALRRSR